MSSRVQPTHLKSTVVYESNNNGEDDDGIVEIMGDRTEALFKYLINKYININFLTSSSQQHNNSKQNKTIMSSTPSPSTVKTTPPSSLLLAHTFALITLSIIYNGASNFQNITDALAFYGVYHRHPINQIIHFFGVPCIIWSLLVFLSHLKIHLPCVVSLAWLPLLLGSCTRTRTSSRKIQMYHELNYATILTMGYILFYIYLDTYGGLLYMPFAYLLYSTAVSLQIQDQMNAREEFYNQMKKDDDNNNNVSSVSKSSNCSSNSSSKPSWIGTGRALKISFIIHFLGWYIQIHPGHGIFEGAKPAVMQSIGGALTSAPLFAYYEGLWYMGLNKELQDRTKELVDVYTVKLCQEGVVMRACADYDLNTLN